MRVTTARASPLFIPSSLRAMRIASGIAPARAPQSLSSSSRGMRATVARAAQSYEYEAQVDRVMYVPCRFLRLRKDRAGIVGA